MKTLILLSLLVIYCSACVNRTQAHSRGMEWVHKNVSYDANKKTDGYIQGCQGIVGYAWQFPQPGIPSWSLQGNYCKKITKSQLKMCDIMVNPSTHQLLWVSWANSDKTSYVAIELGNPHSGSVKMTIPWPYWSTQNPGAYFPCQVHKACATSNQFNLQSEQ